MPRDLRIVLHRLVFIAAVLLFLCISLIPTAPVSAATYTVTNTNDSGVGSLRQAILNANVDGGTNTITFAMNGTITLASTLPSITGTLTITGNGTANTIISGNNAVRPITVASGATVTLNSLTITHGYNSGDVGGAIFNEGSLMVNDSAFTNNSSGWGGAIANINGSTLSVSSSTFQANSSQGSGGCIDAEGTVTVIGSSFDSCTTAGDGGAIFIY